MQIPVTAYQAGLGPRELRVLRPAGPALRATLRYDGRDYAMLATSGAALRIAAFWEMAARSRHTLVHLPVRGDGTAPPSWHAFATAGRGLDLLLAPRALAFPGHEWKALRSRLGPGRASTYSLPDPVLDPPADAAPAEIWNRESTHRLDLTVHAETLIASGDRAALRYARDLFTHVGRGSLEPDRTSGPGYLGNEIHASDPVLRRHEAGIYLYVPRDRYWVTAQAGTAEVSDR